MNGELAQCSAATRPATGRQGDRMKAGRRGRRKVIPGAVVPGAGIGAVAGAGGVIAVVMQAQQRAVRAQRSVAALPEVAGLPRSVLGSADIASKYVDVDAGIAGRDGAGEFIRCLAGRCAQPGEGSPRACVGVRAGRAARPGAPPGPLRQMTSRSPLRMLNAWTAALAGAWKRGAMPAWYRRVPGGIAPAVMARRNTAAIRTPGRGSPVSSALAAVAVAPVLAVMTRAARG